MPAVDGPPKAQKSEPAVLPPPTELRGSADREQRDTEDVLLALDHDRPVTPAEAASALEWFVSEEPEEGTVHKLDVNVGVGDRERWIEWIVRPLDEDELRRINRSAAQMRRRSKDDLTTDLIANVQTLIAGTVEPDIRAIAADKKVDPVAWTRKKFEHKPGLITRIANQIVNLSGFDDEDVRDAIRAKN
jgi:hypothetical protein